VGDVESGDPRRVSRPLVVAIVVVAAPLVVLAALRADVIPDESWENHPAHFWIVLLAAAVAGALGYSVTQAAQRRRDARLLLVSLAFVSSAGFLGLHALATPGVLLGPNAGFELATPVGLVIGSILVAASAWEIPPALSRRLVDHSRSALAALAAVMVAWGAASLAEVPPLDDPVQQERLDGWQVVFAAVAVAGYGIGAIGYARLYRRRGSRFVLVVAVAVALLAVTLVVIAYAVNWQLSWWEWHVVMLGAFALIATEVRREWHEERFSALYLEQTLAGTQDVSVLFADLQGFTSYSESRPPEEVQAMLNRYFSRLVPLMSRMGGEVHDLIGDAVMVVFNRHGDQPGHELLAARAALAFQAEALAVALENRDAPRFRVGVNSGEVASGVVGDSGRRKHDVIGDTVNLAARLESAAPVGGVVIGEGTRENLPEGASVEPLEPLAIKGKAQPVTAYLLRDLPA
jgi:adenylate cyclase